MAPTHAQRVAAEAIKAEANALYGRGKWLAAAERYTEAITLVPREGGFSATLYVNRAMAYKRHGTRWPDVAADATTALSLQGGLMKAHYLLGLAKRELGCVSEAVSHLNKALEAARESGDTIKDEIWRELARTKHAEWLAYSQQRSATAAALKQQLDSMLQASDSLLQASQPWLAAEALGGRDGGSGGKQVWREQWNEVFERAAHLDRRSEVPSCFTCPLTMEVFREPVVTPDGFSYERSVLIEHIRRAGFDPQSRKPLREEDVRPNFGLRNAVRCYLEEHPWAWSECM